ncbi:hypothetical protein NAPIS_ORF01441 [Vairimorpha apis BRL 01]|uniref:Uncharacterized protein n=1 Tax=Vairimorpha apis BRL 01 TaxID=1037528 RepID=T0L983_9MICR|nr:hypothetical protein NAPIS_ORF01441 [Vairimorpha apis BRL 01]
MYFYFQIYFYYNNYTCYEVNTINDKIFHNINLMSENINLIQKKLNHFLEDSNNIIKQSTFQIQNIEDNKNIFTAVILFRYLKKLNININEFYKLIISYQSIISKKNFIFFTKKKENMNEENRKFLKNELERAFYWNKNNLNSRINLLSFNIKILKIKLDKIKISVKNTNDNIIKKCILCLTEIKKYQKNVNICVENLLEMSIDFKNIYKQYFNVNLI